MFQWLQRDEAGGPPSQRTPAIFSLPRSSPPPPPCREPQHRAAVDKTPSNRKTPVALPSTFSRYVICPGHQHWVQVSGVSLAQPDRVNLHRIRRAIHTPSVVWGESTLCCETGCG
ncbi:hypothetical protein SKAU_G00404290 [Synaphobranchus kaupii]|uniref:Uncharacterized protein n=1 Tax=Synaphobranchus kaupii TaxID=118154 RepID=A0A9Q1E9Q9_SYNKA|nr:hypothetical protein SKAU_G00404290 [Synaphobranchus kaupii]